MILSSDTTYKYFEPRTSCFLHKASKIDGKVDTLWENLGLEHRREIRSSFYLSSLCVSNTCVSVSHLKNVTWSNSGNNVVPNSLYQSFISLGLMIISESDFWLSHTSYYIISNIFRTQRKQDQRKNRYLVWELRIRIESRPII